MRLFKKKVKEVIETETPKAEKQLSMEEIEKLLATPNKEKNNRLANKSTKDISN